MHQCAGAPAAGLNPLCAVGSNPNLPMMAEPAYGWQGFNPANNTAGYASASVHPQSINQDYQVSWNNKEAADFGAADGNFSFGSVHGAAIPRAASAAR